MDNLVLISDHHARQLNQIFQRLEQEVRIIHFTQDFECGYCKETRELLQELSKISPKIRLEVYDFAKDTDKAKEFGIDKIPATLITDIGNDQKNYGIRFYGIPSGYEFSSLVEDIIDVSKRKSRLSQKTIERLRSLASPLHIQVFVTLTCPYCPRAVRLAHQFALESPYVKADMIESTEFPQLANRFQVMAVPKTVINEKVSFEGALPEEHFLEQVLLALQERSHT